MVIPSSRITQKHKQQKCLLIIAVHWNDIWKIKLEHKTKTVYTCTNILCTLNEILHRNIPKSLQTCKTAQHIAVVPTAQSCIQPIFALYETILPLGKASVSELITRMGLLLITCPWKKFQQHMPKSDAIVQRYSIFSYKNFFHS